MHKVGNTCPVRKRDYVGNNTDAIRSESKVPPRNRKSEERIDVHEIAIGCTRCNVNSH